MKKNNKIVKNGKFKDILNYSDFSTKDCETLILIDDVLDGEIIKFIFPRLKSFFLKNCSVSLIPSRSFPSLTQLEIENCEGLLTQELVVQTLPQLKSLKITDGFFDKIKIETMSELTEFTLNAKKLVKLDMNKKEFEKLTKFEVGEFVYLDNAPRSNTISVKNRSCDNRLVDLVMKVEYDRWVGTGILLIQNGKIGYGEKTIQKLVDHGYKLYHLKSITNKDDLPDYLTIEERIGIYNAILHYIKSIK